MLFVVGEILNCVLNASYSIRWCFRRQNIHFPNDLEKKNEKKICFFKVDFLDKFKVTVQRVGNETIWSVRNRNVIEIQAMPRG